MIRFDEMWQTNMTGKLEIHSTLLAFILLVTSDNNSEPYRRYGEPPVLPN